MSERAQQDRGRAEELKQLSAERIEAESRLADRLREVAKTAPSQNAFAESVGVTHSIASDWINGKRLPTREQLWSVSQVYDVSVDWLLGFPVPRRRSDRELVGTLRLDLRDELLKDVRRRLPQALSYTAEAVLGDPDQLWEELCTRLRDSVLRAEEQRHRIEARAIVAGLTTLQDVARTKDSLRSDDLELVILRTKDGSRPIPEPVRSQMLALGGLQIPEPRNGNFTRRLWRRIAADMRREGKEKHARWMEALGEEDAFLHDRDPSAHFAPKALRRVLRNLSAKEQAEYLRLRSEAEKAERLVLEPGINR
jgi:transcriptional regulator with XRE-family HTH domain